MDLVAAKVWHRKQLERAERAPSTIANYGMYEQRFLDYLEQHELDPALEMLNPEVVEDCVDWMRTFTKGSRDGAVGMNQMRTVMRAWGRALWKRKVYPHNPMEGAEIPRLKRVVRQPFTEDQARRLLQAAAVGPDPIRDRAFLLLLADTGCRIGELAEATVQDVDAEAGTILFRHTKNGHERLVRFRVPGKRTGGAGVLALKQWLRVRQAQRGVTALFTFEDGWPMDARRLRDRHSLLGKIAGVSPCMPHLWRHTNISEFMAERPGAREQLADRVGHSRLLATYVHVTPRSAESAAGVASLSEKWRL